MNKTAILAMAAVVAASGWGCASHRAANGGRPATAKEGFLTNQSHLIGQVEYNRETREMRVQMTHSSDWYVYREVPPELYEAFAKSGSKGAFFVQEVKGRFPGRREE